MDLLHPLARTPDEWKTAFLHFKEPSFRSDQVFDWIHSKGVCEPEKMTNLPESLRKKLHMDGLKPVLQHESIHRSKDGTRKIVFRLFDGYTIESVLLPAIANPEFQEEDDEDESQEGIHKVRVTQCISTQVGCAMRCSFCASGVAGLKRNLNPEEIISQVIEGRKLLEPGEELRNIVYMGMGEPLHNYNATVRSLRLLTHPKGMGLSPRRITVSTSGLVPQIEQLGKDFDGRIALAISLHSTTNDGRSAIMPINKKYPLEKLIEAMKSYPMPPRRRITIEYTLIQGQNDSAEEAKRLAKLLKGIPVKINLIPMNPIENTDLGPPLLETIGKFQQILLDEHMSCFIRKQRGDAVAAACGQLALKGVNPKVKPR